MSLLDFPKLKGNFSDSEPSSISISGCPVLTSISGPELLEIGDFNIVDNMRLLNLDGFDNLTNITSGWFMGRFERYVEAREVTKAYH